CCSTTRASRAIATRSACSWRTSVSTTTFTSSTSSTARIARKSSGISIPRCGSRRSSSMTAARWPSPTRSSCISRRGRAFYRTIATSARKSSSGCSSSSTATSRTWRSSGSGLPTPVIPLRRTRSRRAASTATRRSTRWRSTSPRAASWSPSDSRSPTSRCTPTPMSGTRAASTSRLIRPFAAGWSASPPKTATCSSASHTI
ncbi:MAG: Glutathione S-transferase, unnamed subgroup, partial [uncultured Solirubrobacteraceae bacterium]